MFGATSNYVLNLEHLAKNLPQRLDRMLYKLEDGNLTVNLKHDEIDRITDKLSMSLILSALLIGSSLTIVSNRGYKLFDVPILGLIGFIFSALLAGYLLINYIRRVKKI